MSESKETNGRKNIVVVGAGFGGLNAARALVRTLEGKKYNLILIGQRAKFTHLLAGLRMLVTDEGRLEKQALIPFDKVHGISHRVGTVTAIDQKEPGNGEVVLEDGERIPYAALVLATGSIWGGPLTAFAGSDDEILKNVAEWRQRFAAAKSVVIVGGGAIGIETAGEIRDVYPETKVTLIHSDSHLLNATYPNRFRKRIEGRVRERNIRVILGDAVDAFPEPGVVGITTRKGEKIPDADLVIPAFGSRPNTSLAASLGEDVLDPTGYVKVKSTLELLNHPGIWAVGDIISWKEQKQAAKTTAHAAVASANIASFLKGAPQKKLYKGSTELILLPVGKNHGAGYIGVLFGIRLGSWLTSMIKGRALLVPMYRKYLGY